MNDVYCEPLLQTLDGETFSANATLTGDNAHPDIRARGFYRPGQNSYFDIKFLNSNSESYLSSQTETRIVPVCLFLQALYFPPPWLEVEQDLVWSQVL